VALLEIAKVQFLIFFFSLPWFRQLCFFNSYCF